MSKKDTRWVQRLAHYSKALAQLGEGIALASERDPSTLEREGIIKRFEYTFELAWNTLKDYMSDQGEKIHGPRDAIKIAFNRGIIEGGQTWMDMIDSRNETVHTYNQDTAEKIYRKIVDAYYGEFIALEKTMLERNDA